MGGGHRPPVSGQPNRAMLVKFGSGLSATITVPNMALRPTGLPLLAAQPPEPSVSIN